jgi:hypothetical protein
MVRPIAIKHRKITQQWVLFAAISECREPPTIELRDFDQMIRFLHWLILFLVTIGFVVALALA